MTQRLRIGLTGGIASGKSTVAQRFVELGVPVIDADESARRVVAPGEPALADIVKLFGPSILAANGELDRRALRGLIFSDPDRRRMLEGLLHPLIRADMERRAGQAVGPYLMLAIPLLTEGGGRGDRMDRILVVDIDERTQLQRLVARDGGTLEQARAIVASQASRASRLKAADDVLVNAGSVPELRQAVDNLHQCYLSMTDPHPGAVG